MRSPGVAGDVEQLLGVTCTSSRSRSSWLGRSPRTPSKTSRQTGTRSGWATHEPSKPSPASRSLSSRTLASARSLTSGSRRLGMNAAMPPIANAPRRWQVDELLGVGPHERRGHRHRAPVGQHEVRPGVAEGLDDAEQVVPAAGVEPGGVRRQLVEDLLHLERRRDGLDQHRGADRAGGRPSPCSAWSNTSFHSRASRWLSIFGR